VKGFIKLDNTPLTLNQQNANVVHTISDLINGNILMLFLCLQGAFDNIDGAWLNPLPYVANAQFTNVRTIYLKLEKRTTANKGLPKWEQKC